MAIYKNSRYALSKVDFVQTSLSTHPKPIVFYDIATSSVLTYFEHIYVGGERIDQISNQYYGVPSLWWYIAQNNPLIKNFNLITPGTVIRVPSV
jgi:hypothetical protein